MIITRCAAAIYHGSADYKECSTAKTITGILNVVHLDAKSLNGLRLHKLSLTKIIWQRGVTQFKNNNLLLSNKKN